jgi:tRNA U34 5-carboxymethylaminomethyl modifying enzyme MnmG/GidA
VLGVKTQLGVTFKSNTVILTGGTFENGLIHVGRNNIKGGRISEPFSTGISEQLKKLDLKSVGLKQVHLPELMEDLLIFQLLKNRKAIRKVENFPIYQRKI